METTLTGLLKAEAVPMGTLQSRYGSLLELVRKLIGVIPNCDAYLEIWPPGFRSYNLMVPNFLNLPFSIWGLGGPTDVVGLAMYTASRTAECAYCSAHVCSFAIRRGAAPEKVAGAMSDDGRVHTPTEKAAIAVARSLAAVPCAVSPTAAEELRRLVSPADVEWIVLGVAMMGFLNKFMDAVGVELEASAVNEVSAVIGPSGWSPGKHLDKAAPRADAPPPPTDGLGTRLGLLPYIPAALSLDRKWTADAPKSWPAVGEYLRKRTGHDFPVLARLKHARAIGAIAAMVRDNLDVSTTVIGLPTKYLAGMIYATVVGDTALAGELRALAAANELASETMDAAARFAVQNGATIPSVDARAQAALRLAKAASPSPAHVASEVADACVAAGLTPAGIVELVVWISVLQMLHRLGGFYTA